jgi:hypothetical protein
MDYEDELAEEKSFKISGNDDDALYEDIDDPLEPAGDEGINFGKEEGEEEEKDSY